MFFCFIFKPGTERFVEEGKDYPIFAATRGFHPESEHFNRPQQFSLWDSEPMAMPELIPN